MEPRQRRFQVASSVRAELDSRGWTHQRLADASQIPLSVLDRKLQGKLPIGVDELDAIANALGVVLVDR
jgi:transcriptional regulator with XRE-family HTH domain